MIVIKVSETDLYISKVENKTNKREINIADRKINNLSILSNYLLPPALASSSILF